MASRSASVRSDVEYVITSAIAPPAPAQELRLPASLVEAIPQIGEHDTAIVMHNDGVVQGLSEMPFMQEVKRWGVLTIGTGLGNARFTNRSNGRT
jgi:hypothetical protein